MTAAPSYAVPADQGATEPAIPAATVARLLRHAVVSPSAARQDTVSPFTGGVAALHNGWAV